MEEYYNKLKSIVAARKQSEAERLAENRERSKEYISNKIKKDLLTIAIGNISKIEQEFGVLWGHGKQNADLSESERAWRLVWEAMREEMLDAVNARIRRAQSELVKFDILHVGYFYRSL